ncbi:DUF4138 domain-containing protein [Aggregatimonas sangjinii]|nr:DUF4138 domain-containing protein [Aggregatimonas sangjinii]
MKLKSAFLLSLFLLAHIAIAQANNLPITVVANESITVTLFFPSEIQRVIKPAVNYRFQYEQHGTMGTLVARKGAASNLTVITKDGSIFSFLLQYEQEVNNFTYVLSADHAIGTINPSAVPRAIPTEMEEQATPQLEDEAVQKPRSTETTTISELKLSEEAQITSVKEPQRMTLRSEVGAKEKTEKDFTESEQTEAYEGLPEESSLYETDRESYYAIFCENQYNQDLRSSKSIKAGTGIELQLNTLTADKNELYFIFQATNRLTSKFKAEKLRFYVRSSVKGKPLQITPLYIYKHLEEVEAGRTKKMIYVLKEFRLSTDQKVYVVLDEKDGMRNTVLNIDGQLINAVGERSLATTR